MANRTPGIVELKRDWSPEEVDFQAHFQTNLAVWQSAVAVYELNVKSGVPSTEEEFRKCFAIAKELLTPTH